MRLLVAALLTYLLHSTVLLLAAAGLSTLLRERRLALQEAVLRAALVGGFLTSALQLGLDLSPAAGIVQVPLIEVAAPGSAVGARPAAPVPAVPTEPDLRGAWFAAQVVAPERAARAEAPTVGAPAGDHAAEAKPLPVAGRAISLRSIASRALAFVGEAGRSVTLTWSQALAAVWCGLSLLALTRLLVAGHRLGRLLAGRRPLPSSAITSRAAALAARLGLRRPVRLSTVPRLSIPLATGVLRPEVCLPTRAVAELGADEQAALCAHELAHLARRDPAWILLARVAEVAAPLQPLNVWARRRLQDIAECLSDDLAVSASASPLGLARSLVDVASWTLGARNVLPLAAGAFGARSRLGQRVERLMDPVRDLERPRRLVFPLAVLAALTTAALIPVVSAAPSQPQAEEAVAPAPPPPAPETAPVAPAPPAPAAPVARPAPPARAARPAPAARPARAPHPAPAVAGDAAAAEVERRIEALSAAIAARASAHEGELKKLEQEIERLASRMTPDEQELERLGEKIGQAAAELAAAVGEGVEAGRKSDHAKAAERRLAELQGQLKEATKDIRLPEAELRALTERARELAEAVKPTAAEVEELRRLSEQAAAAALAAVPAEEIARAGREAGEQAREAMKRVHEELRRAHEQMKQERDGLQGQREELRRQREELRRLREELKQQQDELRRQQEELKRKQEQPRQQSQAEPARRERRAQVAALTAALAVVTLR